MLFYVHTRLFTLVRPLVVTIVVIGVLTLQFFGSANGWELVRHFCGLQQHYLEHQVANPDTTFANFLTLHFGDLQNEHKSQHDHSGLPFQDGPHHEVVVFGFVWIAHRIMSAYSGPIVKGYSSVDTADRTWSFPELTYDIWQPPRNV